MIVTIYICIGFYVLLIMSFIYGFLMLKNDTAQQDDATAFSIVIPFRNEADHLPDLLLSIEAISYNPNLFEIIFVDDASTDASVQIIQAFLAINTHLNISILDNVRNSNSPKKDAISTAISFAQHEWIVTTDADCIVPQKWLQCFNTYILQHQPNMIVAPVTLVGNTSFLHQFQSIDFLSMQGATMGGFGLQQPFMANGANLGYKKKVFLQLNGFSNNDNIASGDDVFLLEDFIAHDKKAVHFLKNTDALVQTYVLDSWKALINQRKRWAAKAPKFNNNFTIAVGVLVFFANLLTAIAIVLVPFYGVLGYVLMVKIFIDSVLIFKTAAFYQQPICVRQYLKIVLFYPFFTIYIAFTSLLIPFTWKERVFKQ